MYLGIKVSALKLAVAPTEEGIDANVYPLYATYNFGVNVTF